VWQGYSGEYGVEPTNLVPNLLNYLAFATCCWAASSSPFISRHTALRLDTGILSRSPSRTMKPVNYRFRWPRRAQHRGPSNRHGSMAESGPSYPVDILHGRKRKAAAQCLYYRHTFSRHVVDLRTHVGRIVPRGIVTHHQCASRMRPFRSDRTTRVKPS